MKVKTIEVTKYSPIPERPGCVKATDSMSYEAIFMLLGKHLKEHDLLPEEYFAPAYNKKYDKAPKEGWFEAHAEWGGSEGIYVNIYVIDPDTNQRIYVGCGKTLQHSKKAYILMKRVEAEIEFMLNGGGSETDIPYDENYTFSALYKEV